MVQNLSAAFRVTGSLVSDAESSPRPQASVGLGWALGMCHSTGLCHWVWKPLVWAAGGSEAGAAVSGPGDPVTYKVPMLSRGTGVSEERPPGTGTPVSTETNLT